MSSSSAERLIVAADFSAKELGGRAQVREAVLRLAGELRNTGVYIKVNSALRACGYGLIDQLHEMGLRVFADLKLVDIPNTLKQDGELLAEARPELLTVMCQAGVVSMSELRAVLPMTETLGVTVLTSFDDTSWGELYDGQPIADAVQNFAQAAMDAKMDGLVLSGRELSVVLDCHPKFEFKSYNVPAIRPVWSIKKDEDQKRIVTIAEAFNAGATRIVVGRPITAAESPKEAFERTLAEIEQATAH